VIIIVDDNQQSINIILYFLEYKL